MVAVHPPVAEALQVFRPRKLRQVCVPWNVYRRKIKAVCRNLQRAKRRIKKLEDKLSAASQHSLAISHKGALASRSLVWEGSIACALRVTIGDVSAICAGLVLLESKTSRQTVTRAEVHTSGALKFAARCNHHALLRALGDGSAAACRGAIS